MKKNIFRLGIIALVGLTLAGCDLFGGGEEVEFKQSDLYGNGGMWMEDNTQHYMHFTEEDAQSGYMYGREWDEADGIYESDLKDYGNGWFKYLLEKKGGLTQINLMDNGGAEIPKQYVVTVLTDTELKFYEKDYKNITYTFHKVVEAQ